MSPDKIRKLAMMGRLVPIIKSTDDGKHYLLGYKRKATSRKKENYMLPEPELLTGNI
jgi:uncharacterized protein (DUF4213/DUF364 family)